MSLRSDSRFFKDLTHDSDVNDLVKTKDMAKVIFRDDLACDSSERDLVMSLERLKHQGREGCFFAAASRFDRAQEFSEFSIHDISLPVPVECFMSIETHPTDMLS